VPELKWVAVEDAEPGETVVVLASRLELRSRRHTIGFFRAATAVRRQVRGSAGALGVALLAKPLRRTYWTLSAWRDQAALDAFVETAPHTGTMARFRPLLRDSKFVTWQVPAGELPISWDEARERL
jgi:heme-degrading monooxygenase HmoA